MSTRATLYIHWHDWEMDVKLYHHRDGYVEYLGRELEKALEKWRKWVNRMLKWKWFNNHTLIQCIADIGWFELARPSHWDAEYVYHVNYGINDRKAWYELHCQSWNVYGEENIRRQRMALLCTNWEGKPKKLDWKQAEKELWNTEKFIDGYLD